MGVTRGSSPQHLGYFTAVSLAPCVEDNPALSFATKFDAVVPVFILESEKEVTGAARALAGVLWMPSGND